MKVTNASLSSADANNVSRAQPVASSHASPVNAAVSVDDIHFSELVRSLRSLVADPERQARIEQIARSYASGTHQVDAEATASKIIDAAFQAS